MGFDLWLDQLDPAVARAYRGFVNPVDALLKLSRVDAPEDAATAPASAKH
jgi:hypothetical protein